MIGKTYVLLKAYPKGQTPISYKEGICLYRFLKFYSFCNKTLFIMNDRIYGYKFMKVLVFDHFRQDEFFQLWDNGVVPAWS